jgi:hypothetical protein
MLNVEMGLYRDLDGYIYTKVDVGAGVEGTLYRACEEGIIKDYPSESTCVEQTSRVLATCFNTHPQASQCIEQASASLEGWIAKLGLAPSLICS